MPEVSYSVIMEGLRYLRDLPPTEAEALVSAFEAAEPIPNLDVLAYSVAARAGLQPDNRMRNLVYALSHLFMLIEDGWGGIEQIANTFANTAADSPDHPNKLYPLLMRLLACERSIGVAAKAQTIMW